MKKQVILEEADILQAIAERFGVNKNEVNLRHFRETIGQGYSEEDIDRVEITVNLPIDR